MAGRPQKQTVDFFPHDAVGGKTLFILQNRFGNNGFSTWFKLLMLLCRTPGHAYNCSKPTDWQFLVAEMALSVEETQLILDCLAELEAIDPELWQQKTIWSQNLVNRLSPVYRERKAPIPIKPPTNGISPPINSINPPLDNTPPHPPNRVKESKVNKSKGKGDRGKPAVSFEDFKESLRVDYPDLNFDEELKAFHLYWSEGGRKLQRPKTALFNWMRKARQIKQERGNGGKDLHGTTGVPGKRDNTADLERFANS